MHGRIIRAVLALTLLVPAAVASAHDVHMKAIFASVPLAVWDAQTHTWTITIAGMIDCDANGERVDGVVFAEPAGGGGGALAALQLSGTPRQIFSDVSPGLAPGVYRLNFAAAACSAQAQGDNDEGQHGDSFENIAL